MGYSIKSIPFFTDEITIIPHTVRYTGSITPGASRLMESQFLGREVSIREFCAGEPCALEQVEETGEYIVRLKNGDFIQGPEC
jgi:hypothetical protein